MSKTNTLLFEADHKLGVAISDLEDLTINKNRSVNIHDVLREITQSQEIIREFLSKNTTNKESKDASRI
jgi:hypothetical protein